ncbi:CGNR zinc finger domain-containing protein [Streptomyces varsoviensis]|uniref:CGNR zinc finger domain-containing protein n=1 Tax=Streptomyces varsoviensis TaxID=67373 RepID=UPI0004CC052B|nr:CGNR zinc finger domain-containing protein [Streptomyces varsoviensis]
MLTSNSAWSARLSVQNTARRTAALINALSAPEAQAGARTAEAPAATEATEAAEATSSPYATSTTAGATADALAVADVLRAYGEPDPLAISAEDIAEMREAADALREVFAAGSAGAAAAVLNALLQRTTGTLRLTSHSDGSPWHPHLDSHDDAPWGEWLLASSCLALTVLVWDRQCPPGGVCASPSCRAVFVTLNSGPARRYCSRRCATRERVAAHRRARG